MRAAFVLDGYTIEIPVPDYQSFMRPLLQSIADGTDHRMRDVCARLAAEFQLSEADMNELLPSGRQATYLNRIGWAKTYLLKAGAVESPVRGFIRITNRGHRLLADHTQAITTKLLLTFPEFAQFQGIHNNDRVNSYDLPQESPDYSPEERLDVLYAELTSTLANDLLFQVRQLTPQQFEVMVVRLLVAMGYGGSTRDAGEALGRTGDNGVDGVVKQDPLGLDKVYIQAKRWENKVGSQEIRNFAGSLTYHRASKGVFITASEFSPSALDTARQIGSIILIDGQRLAELMIQYDVGVITRTTYHIKRVDSEFFEEI